MLLLRTPMVAATMIHDWKPAVLEMMCALQRKLVEALMGRAFALFRVSASAKTSESEKP